MNFFSIPTVSRVFWGDCCPVISSDATEAGVSRNLQRPPSMTDILICHIDCAAFACLSALSLSFLFCLDFLRGGTNTPQRCQMCTDCMPFLFAFEAPQQLSVKRVDSQKTCRRRGQLLNYYIV